MQQLVIIGFASQYKRLINSIAYSEINLPGGQIISFTQLTGRERQPGRFRTWKAFSNQTGLELSLQLILSFDGELPALPNSCEIVTIHKIANKPEIILRLGKKQLCRQTGITHSEVRQMSRNFLAMFIADRLQLA